MIQISLLLFVFFALSHAQNSSSSVEVNDMERVKKDEDMTVSPREEEKTKLEEVKNELERAVQSLNSTQSPMTTPIPVPNLQSCTALDCNNRGTCLGTRSSFICACQLGFSGRSCEETVCNSTTDCNGRGICFGTSSSVTCLCNLGFGGPRCETAF